MSGIADFFYKAAIENPKKEAIWCDGKRKTYAEFMTMVNQYSNYFLSLGMKYRDNVGIVMNNSIESVAVMISAANIGIALVPLNPSLPAEAVNRAIQYGDVSYLIARKNFFDRFHADLILRENAWICMDQSDTISVSLDASQKCEDERPHMFEITGDEPYLITMTSGSTGEPKPIVLTQNDKYRRAVAHISLYHITSDDRILAATPLYHSLAERLVIMPLILGATSILLPRFTPDLWVECVKNQRVSFTIAVSSQLKQVAKLLENIDERAFESLRCIVSSSMLLEDDVKYELADKLQCEFHEMYGTSETSTVTDIHITQDREKARSVGKPLKEAEIYIVSDSGKQAAVGETGVILCRSDLMCSGYYRQEEIFKSATYNGYFNTGDMGYVDEDGYLFFSGRKKEIIISGGINIYPSDIENCISGMAGVAECAAFPYPDVQLGEVVAVAVRLEDGMECNIKRIQFWCVKRLADYQQPRKIFIVDALPKNSMGKIMKSELYDYVKMGE